MIFIKKLRDKIGLISIKFKIFLYLLGFCALLLVLLWLAQIVFLDSFYKSIKISKVKKSAEEIIQNINSEDLTDIIEDISSNNQVSIEMISQNGALIYPVSTSKQETVKTMPLENKLELIKDAFENGGELLGYYKTEDFHRGEFDDIRFKEGGAIPFGDSMESIIYTKIIDSSDGGKLAVIINSVISPVDATVSTLRIQLYFITGIMIAFSVFLALVIAKRVSKPIESINMSAKTLAKGEYDVKFQADGFREIKELADTLTYAASELSKVDNLRQELIANVSHDLRTPLTLIGGYAEAMRDLPNENTPENAQIIIDETKRLTTLVHDILDISKLQSGVQEPVFQSFNLTSSISAVVSRLEQLLNKDGFKIRFINDGDVFVTADETLISQAFYNILINAVNYSGEDKIIIVRQSNVNSKVKIEVIDSGEGISPEKLPYIWERYYKADKTHKRAVIGTGLGLSIVKSIINLHGGKYGAISKPGEGSIFWFEIDCLNDMSN